jgi:monoamine oxidase
VTGTPFRGRLSRRGFIAGAAAGAFVPLVAGPRAGAALGTPSNAPRVAIVGAGIAGMSAALALHDRGIRATVYEAQRRIGGRMHSESAFWGNGQTSEYGGELIDSDHTTMQALCKRFGLPLTDVLADQGTRQQTIFENGAYYPERELFTISVPCTARWRNKSPPPARSRRSRTRLRPAACSTR